MFSLSSVADAVENLNAAMLLEQPSQAALEAARSALFAALFNGQVSDMWREALTLAHEHHESVRLCLYSELPSLIALPWEYLYDPVRARWLALDADLSLVRALPLATAEPLRVEKARCVSWSCWHRPAIWRCWMQSTRMGKFRDGRGDRGHRPLPRRADL